MGLAGPTGATSKQEGSLAWAVGITLNGYPLHTPSHARVPAEPQSGPTNSFGRCKCWVLILADRGWPGVRGVKGIPISANSSHIAACSRHVARLADGASSRRPAQPRQHVFYHFKVILTM